MYTYKNKVTGVTVTTYGKVTGKNWELVEDNPTVPVVEEVPEEEIVEETAEETPAAPAKSSRKGKK